MRFLIIIFFILSNILNAQQHTNYTQFFNNEILYNPATAGSKPYNPLALQTRQQWLGFEGAPFSTSISYHKLINESSAFGGVFNFENTTPSQKLDLQPSYAFHVPLNSNKTFLSFGIAPALMYYSVNFELEDMPTNQDPAFSESTYSSLSFDIGSGVYMYNDKLSLGFSVVNMLQSSFDGEVLVQSNQSFGKTSFGENLRERIFFTSFSYDFDIINNDWSFQPFLLLRNFENKTQILDLFTRIKYLKNNWAGFGYRSEGVMSFSFGFNSDKLHFGYSFDFATSSNVMNNSYGTHELMISYHIPAFQHNRHTNFWIF